MRAEDAIKLFGLNNLSIESDLRKIEASYGSHVKNQRPEKSNEKYYPQFSSKLRSESADMAAHYAIFYCLENTIRDLIKNRLEDAHGPEWWNVAGVVPINVAKNCEDNRRREAAAGITPRSENMIDYSNFGELGEIIRSNWDFFGESLKDRSAVNRILASLNTLRAPIAHCKALAEDEVLRLHLALRDWFRQMS